MAGKRIISDIQRAKLAESKAHKGKDITSMSDAEVRDLVKILAKKAGLL